MLFTERISRYIHKFRDYLYQKNLLKGSRAYTRFIVLGTGRTGSNMLVSALMGHPDAVVYGEIFNNARHDRIFFENPAKLPYIRLSTALKVRENDPIRFLEDYIFRNFRQNIAAVGFKLFYWHCHEPQWRCVWDTLTADKTIKVIHIKRRNRLKTLLSLKLAQKSKQWSQKGGRRPEDAGPLELDYDECRRIFEDWAEKEAHYDDLFRDHPMREVVYEELCSDYSAQMGDIQSFLGLSPSALRPLTAKQSQRRLADRIANYWELKEKFSQTEWESFFID